MLAETRRYPTAAELMEAAVAHCGLHDFGPGDFRDGLERLLDSLERDGDLDPAADAPVVDDLRRRLINRLEVEAWYRDHPEIDQLEVAGPVDINGLPRTGTTALANMMSLDAQFRCLRGWEQNRPCPPPTTADEANDPRRKAAAEAQQLLPPEAKALHLYDLDATMEDTELLGMAFHGQGYTLPVYSYHAWWRHTDMESTYRYHRRVVKLLQSQRPPNLWLFKAPHHMFHLEAIVGAYPDVRFVMTHRDPARVVPSYVSTVNLFFPPPYGERDMRRLGREVSEHLRDGMVNTIAARDRLGEDRFIDVHHHDLVADPLGALARVYEFLGLPLTKPFLRSAQQWHERNRPGAHGVHSYTAQQFGLDPDRIREDFRFYIDRFDVTVES
ncbi:sulfotransferase [Mycobacteriaceae bacterium 1482268.1]|nr:sulfotransferase [Mycobacteriaceae bacterium 1482268.1]